LTDEDTRLLKGVYIRNPADKSVDFDEIMKKKLGEPTANIPELKEFFDRMKTIQSQY